MIITTNDDQLILKTNYWESDQARWGKIYCEINGGAIRLLLPEILHSMVDEVQSSKYVILSRGPWPEMDRREAVELLFEDFAKNPYVITLTPESFNLLPARPDGKEWLVALWLQKDGRPHRALERPCKWRRVRKIPCLRPW